MLYWIILYFFLLYHIILYYGAHGPITIIDFVHKQMDKRREQLTCSTRKYKNIIYKIRKLIPDASISSDVIVGFPGETHAQFLETIELIEENL